MSSSTNPRIKRLDKPPRVFLRGSYRDAYPFLVIEFEDRCAFSDLHRENAGGESCLHVEHFDPRLKNRYRQDYFNLILSSAHCNLRKGNFWPKKSEKKKGIRLLNPTAEPDFGVHIAEVPSGHQFEGHLWGKTPTGCFHIEKLGLNASHIVGQRRCRNKLLSLRKPGPVTVKSVPFFLQVKEASEEFLGTLPRQYCIEDPPANYDF